MQIDGWKYYNHAAIPTTAPHESVNMRAIQDNSVWQIEGSPLLARWVTEFDCKQETNWWYVIKDTPFDISKLKAKRRYEINKGVKNFNVIPIDPIIYKEDLYKVQTSAFLGYPEKYRPIINTKQFFDDVENWKQYVVVGAFCRESNELCGYALLSRETNNYVDFKVLKTNPEHEKKSVNAALVEGVMRYFDDFLKGGGYICDGARSINHETAFQDYLEKYFDFRKAYCRLHIKYRLKLKWLIKLTFPFRTLLLKFDRIRTVHLINSILRMEELCRSKNGG